MAREQQWRLEATLASVGAAVAYGCSAKFGPGWGDAAVLARETATAGLRPGARSYPAQAAAQMLAEAIVGNPARAASVASVALSAAAVGVVYAVARGGLRLSRSAAATAAGALLVCHVNWTSAVEGEVYGGLAFLAAAAVGVAFASPGWRREAGAGALLGLSFLHHRLSIPVICVAIVAAVVGAPRGARGRALLRVAAGLSLGALPCLALIALTADATQFTWTADSVVTMLIGSPRHADLMLGDARELGASLAYIVKWLTFDMIGPGLVLVGLGLVALPRSQKPLAAALLLAGLLVPLRLGGVGDRHVFLAAVYPLLAVLAGLGAERLAARWPSVRRALLPLVILVPVGLYWGAARPAVASRLLPGLTDEAAAEFLFPVRTARGDSRAWARRVLPPLGADAVVFAEWGAAGALTFVQEIDALRQDVRVSPRPPTRDQVSRAGSTGVVVVLMPIWRDPLARLEPLGGTITRLGPDTYRVVATD